MHDSREYLAPWSGMLKLVSVVASLLFIAGAVILAVVPAVPAILRWIGVAVLPGTVVACALFTIRGYRIERSEILVRRLLWSSRLPLKDLQSVEVDPGALNRSIRLCGNGGLFAFSGWFRNRKLGSYRLCATDPARAVVLRFSRGTWVLSPDRPEVFAREIRDLSGLKPRSGPR